MCLPVKSVLISNTENDYMNQLFILISLYEKAFIKCVIEIRRYKKININLKFVLFSAIFSILYTLIIPI